MAPPESAALPREFRYSTPESTVISEAQRPSAPRAQPRLRIKRRNVSGAPGPTESFLASVAAADLAIPSIEYPDSTTDCEMIDVGLLSSRPGVSPPKTPMPGLPGQDHGDSYRRTDWYADTPGSPGNSPTRPSSSHSAPSNWSDDSYFSGNNTMRSNGTICTSPESEMGDPFVATPYKDSRREKHAVRALEVNGLPFVAHPQIRHKKYVEVRWTKDQSDHLLRTYHLYLQDPTVTPFRMENSSIPPEGIVYRVSKEAKRSWKGPKPKKPSRLDSGKERLQHASSLTVESALLIGSNADGMDFANSRRSLTPTGDAPKAYIKWPHSGAATRGHLRALCKNNHDQSAQMYMYLQTRSTTPFTHHREDNSITAADSRMPLYYRSDSKPTFSTKDIALSLVTSTSESMQPDGPLARLALNSPSVPTINVTNETNIRDFAMNTSNALPRRLGSPFCAKTYGPQSSKPLQSTGSGASKSLNSTLRISQSHSNTITARVPLRSPLHLDNSRSLTATQKRRAQHDPEDGTTSTETAARPSILDNHVFGPPDEPNQRRVRSRGYTVGDASLRQRDYACFAPQSINFASPQNDVFGPGHRSTQSASHSLSRSSGFPKLELLPPPVFTLPGRPVPEHSTFPRRILNPYEDPFQFPGHPMNLATVRRRPYHTTQTAQHQTRHSIESFDFSQSPSMQSRLTQLDQRLKQFNKDPKPDGDASDL